MPDRASGNSVRRKSHAGADSDKDKQQRAREPKQDRNTNKVPTRRRIERLKADEGSNKDLDDDAFPESV